MATWVKFYFYSEDKSSYVIDLDKADGFRLLEYKRERTISVVIGDHFYHIEEKHNRDLFRWMLEYIKNTTGYTLP